MPDVGWTDIPSLPQAVADWIGTGIVNGRWAEGDRLREVEIATELGISRAPVREAIRVLHERGLVQHRPRTGAVVNAFTLQTIREVYAVRAALEGWIVRQSVPNLTAEDRKDLGKHLAVLADTCDLPDRDAFFDAGWGFRQTLYRGYPNAVALGVVDTLRSRLHSLPQVLRQEQSYVDKTLTAYKSIRHHVDRGRADAAAHVLEALLRDSGEQMCTIFDSRTADAVDADTANPGRQPQ